MRTFSRREFTRSAAMATLCAPFLNLLDPRPARAVPGKAKYFLLFYTNGTDTAVWSPKGSSESSISLQPDDRTAGAHQRRHHNRREAGQQRVRGQPWLAWRLCGMNYGATPLLSIEQFISDGLKAAGVRTPVANLLLGATNEAPQQTTFYRDNTAITPVFSPTAAYQAIFSGFQPGSGGGTTTAASGGRCAERAPEEVPRARQGRAQPPAERSGEHRGAQARPAPRLAGAAAGAHGRQLVDGDGRKRRWGPTPTVNCTVPGQADGGEPGSA